LCLTPLPTITPTMTVTPTVTPTEGTIPPSLSPTPTQTSTTTQTPTQTPTKTPTPTPTPTPTTPYVYVFETCQPVFFNTQNSMLIQTLPYGSLAVGGVVKDWLGTCWTYLGRYNTNYIPPTNVISSTYEGDNFSSSFNQSVAQTFSDCSTCLPPPVISPPTNKFLYESCSILPGNVYKTRVVQTVQHPGITTVGQALKTPQLFGTCFTYLGEVSNTYVIPGNFVPIIKDGDYFSPGFVFFGDSTIYAGCQDCLNQFGGSGTSGGGL